MRRDPVTIDRLPLFASDEDIGEAVLGVKRKGEFPALAASLERYGMPKVNPTTGWRYVPAVRAFLDHMSGLAKEPPQAVDGRENPDAWTNQRRKRQG